MPNRHPAAALIALALISANARAQTEAPAAPHPAPDYAPWPDSPTPLEDFVRRPDDAYEWSLQASADLDGASVHHLRLVSQRWLTPEQVSHPLWTHRLSIVVPEPARSVPAILVIGGGRRSPNPPDDLPPEILALARATGASVAHLDNVPNQPLRFAGDDQPRTEDSIMARAWVLAMDENDPERIARFPMVKAAVRALDAADEFLDQQRDATEAHPRAWFLIGASKRGWTTWLTGAIDDRVVGMAPLVIDVLNLPAQMRHHHAAYGFWAPALNDYVREGVTDRIGSPQLLEVFRHEDPLLYQSRIDVPVYIVNAAGDQFFPTDSASLYTPLLHADWRLRIHPNAEHSLEGTTALEEIAAFYAACAQQTPVPTLRWTTPSADRVVRCTASTAPTAFTLWTATNPAARDFRVGAIGRSWKPTPLQPADQAGRVVECTLPEPETGWTAAFIECTFAPARRGTPALALTTHAFVSPDTLPHEGALDR